ncbi:LuxR family transcriptional regulator [Roseovarius halotolerans]|uniref:Transcriptional activator protein LuxR n=1 Tax=Roseovarius halotolerans TaxID=505353 RepID=A0A1X6YNL5_9RHOB|nr:LuxR family transcriptional regulator [Roseovarius halotolerans]RKT34150.1 LuxR family transcriptional regulator [Roseovarius halotolerans]SLN26580.1 Transcriptional activator protein LuxR [Roseovarius halotolerans]
MVCCDRINELINVSSIEQLWDLHTQHMAGYGFDRILYGYTRYRTPTSLGDPDDFILLTNHSRDYTDVYIGESLYTHAPMVRWALEHEGACSWSVLRRMLNEGVLNDGERRVVEFNRSQGVTAGYSISFKSLSTRSKGAIALTGRNDLDQAALDSIWTEHGQEILALNNIVHLRIQTLPYSTEKRALTRRQREVLGWVGDGKTIQDIALLMSLNPATVEKHLRLAREALGVETTAQAVLKAAFQNQMFVLDP